VTTNSTRESSDFPGGAARWVVIEHSVRIDAPASLVWRALTEEIGRWWRDGFYALSNAKGMRLEPVIGGRMYEHADDGSAVVWFRVIAVQPGRSIDLAGHISVSFGGPAVAMLRFDVTADGSRTVVKVAESRVGAVDEHGAASAKKGWTALLDGGLKPYCESSPR
jgi:uncharacterized protein YndB with AHSA1/START domain